MRWVGLTGGVGAGKSTVAAMLAARGAAVRDADRVVEDLYAPGEIGTVAVATLFGADVLASDGGVDRVALRGVVLADAEARRRLEAAIHPLVRQELRRWRQWLLAAAAPPAVAIVEAALLVETGAHRMFDRLVVVTAPLEVRRRRALAAGWSREAFDRTVAAQLPEDEKTAVATDVVVNDGELPALAAQVAALWVRLTAGDAAPG